jgi:hypothetical protein
MNQVMYKYHTRAHRDTPLQKRPLLPVSHLKIIGSICVIANLPSNSSTFTHNILHFYYQINANCEYHPISRGDIMETNLPIDTKQKNEANFMNEIGGPKRKK